MQSRPLTQSLRLCALGVVCIGTLMMSLFVFQKLTEARNMSTIRDTLTTSAPSQYSNHTIEFTVNTDIPAGGYITLTPEDGAFNIPTSTFSYLNVDLYVSDSLRSATATADATNDGIAVTSGTSGQIAITLNSTTGITSGSDIRVEIGNTTVGASTTVDTGWQNPSTVGSHTVYLEAGGGAEAAYAKAFVAIVDQVTVGPADTRETVPPNRFNGNPSGTLPFSTQGVELSLSTNEFSFCRYSTASGTPFYSMGLEFDVTGIVTHTQDVSGFSPGNTYTYYVRCIDDEGNFNIDDYEITFTVGNVPSGNPGTGSSTDSTGGGGTGTNPGSTGAGSGTSNGGGSGSGSGGSGGGGGSNTGEDDTTNGGGGFESTAQRYPSGDARVVITGYAFPGSTVTALVDGYVSETARATNQGEFTITIDAIARGVYTFGVYATDGAGTKSSTFSTSFSVIGARTSNLSNIHIMPTIKVSPDPVNPGSTLTFSGYAVSNSTVSIETQQEKTSASKKTYTATSDGSGKWSVQVDTTGFAQDTWKVRAKSANATTGVSTQFSNYTFYGVGQKATGLNSDLNRDGKVNLVDFSILLFHWNTDGGTSDPPADINHDGKVTLTDFSIMIFNWTG